MSTVCAFACHRPSIHHLRPSATVAAWHPGPAAPFRGKASARLDCISLPPACVATAPRHLRPLVFARLHPRPGRRRRVLAASPAASRCSPSLATLPVCLGYCPTDSGGATTDQHYCHVHRRKPARLRRAGSRLGFYRSPVTAMSSSHRLTAARFRSLPGGTRLGSGFCQYAGPSDNRALCKVAEPCRPCASTLRYRFAYGYIMQAIIRRASWWRQFTKGSRCAFASVGFGQVRPFLACLAASLSAPRFS